jgi:hypothetical protein
MSILLLLPIFKYIPLFTPQAEMGNDVFFLSLVIATHKL